MDKPKRTYAGAGTQKNQGWSEMHRYGEFEPDRLVTVQCIALVLGIRLQMVSKIPVKRHMIDKRGYYRKGDIDAWLLEDLAKPDSLLRELRAQHAKSLKRMQAEPSRRYVASRLTKEESNQVKAANAVAAWSMPTKDELTRAWSKRDAKDNRAVPGLRPLSEKDAEFAEAMAAHVREELKRGK